MSGFLQATDGQFTLDGQRHDFVGGNAYYMPIGKRYGFESFTTNLMAACQQRGLPVLRTWATGEGYDGATPLYQPTPGAYDPTMFSALDWVVKQASDAGVKLILALGNHNGHFGGVPKYAEWAGIQVRQFYGHAQCREWFRNYITYVLTRVNPLTGREYRQEPAIAGWQVMAEPSAQGSGNTTGTVIAAWVQEMVTHAKNLDANHLVGTGEEGYDSDPSLYTPGAYGNNNWLIDGTKCVSWSKHLEYVDFASVEWYGDWGTMTPEQGVAWIADHARLARDAGKPLLLNEYGHWPTWIDQDPHVLHMLLSTCAEHDVAGSLAWVLTSPGAWVQAHQAIHLTGPMIDTLEYYAGIAVEKNEAASLEGRLLALEEKLEALSDIRVAMLEDRLAELEALRAQVAGVLMT
jgi:mannan endo-1,4-beta-mannosidase